MIHQDTARPGGLGLMQAIKVTLNSGVPAMTEVELDLSSPQQFEMSLGRDVPAVFLVRREYLDTVDTFVDIVENRGVKGPSEHLAKKFLHRGVSSKRVAMLDAPYKSTVKLPQSIKAFLKRLKKSDEERFFVIGLPTAIFSKIFETLRSAVTDGQSENEDGPPSDTATWLSEHFVGESSQADWVRRLIYRASRVDNTVLILGETGSGKEIVANSIHALHQVWRTVVLRPELADTERSTISAVLNQQWGRGNFQPLNCAAIPKELLESELFGHVKGSFTGALSDKKGLWESAHGGTLFLDEIGDLHPEHQAKILRALETNIIRRVGSNREIDVRSVRVVAATNRDLAAMVKAGQFREDLYYRLMEFVIRTPFAERPSRGHRRPGRTLLESLDKNSPQAFADNTQDA